MEAIYKEICDALIKKKKFNPILCALCRYTISKSASTCANWKKMLETPDNEKVEKDFDERREFARMPGDFEENELT